MEFCGSPTRTERDVSLMRALRSSVSFGRFVSESLDWGRWSSFRHNRYLEDAARYSVRGSVAERKAFFEAHYKKKLAQVKAAEDNSNAQSGDEGEIGGCMSDGNNDGEPLDFSFQSQNMGLDAASDQEEDMQYSSTNNGLLMTSIDRMDLDKENYWLGLDDVKFNAFDVSLTELGAPQVVEGVANQNVNGIEVDKISQAEELLLKEILVSNERKVEDTRVSEEPISKPTFVNGSPKLLPSPEKDASPVRCMKENKLPSITKLCGEKKKLALNAILMSTDSYQPCNREISPSLAKTSSVLEKVKAFAHFSKTSQDCSQTIEKRSSKGSGDCMHHHFNTTTMTASRNRYSVSKPIPKVSEGHSHSLRISPTIPSKVHSSSIRPSKMESSNQGTDTDSKPSQADSGSSKLANSGRSQARIQPVSSSLSMAVDEKVDKRKDGSPLLVSCYVKDILVSNEAKRLQLHSKGQVPLPKHRSPILGRKVNHKESADSNTQPSLESSSN